MAVKGDKKLFAAEHSIYGLQNWFDPNRKMWDPENKYLFEDQILAVDRGITKLYYNPKKETTFKRIYMITVDIWNYN